MTYRRRLLRRLLLHFDQDTRRLSASHDILQLRELHHLRILLLIDPSDIYTDSELPGVSTGLAAACGSVPGPGKLPLSQCAAEHWCHVPAP